ncbi:TetR family transcriptional regulator [Altererythrobacter xixiisoli]|uniref:TetR family transcriptional regulator n=1 Tax=Croceibacterium xixiisoli TaxID=1476466 RepID=A0A6I4TXL8_9SPHN|nr:TetR family transcriptional regulator [Croceibacterium xixiisoli]MXP00673.1 TetR family transcriptional regulator [Croceibacterium xixiisoli]
MSAQAPVRRSRPRGRPARDRSVCSRELGDAAITLFAAKGYDATTLKDIAEVAAVDPSLISYQFGSKLDLWKAVIVDVGDQLRAKFAEIRRATQGDDVEPAMRRTLADIVHFMLEHPRIAHFMARDTYRDNERADWVEEKLAGLLFDYLRPALDQLRAAGRLRPGTPDMLLLHFNYSLSFSIIRRERLVRAAPELADDAVFAAELTTMLVGSILRDD